MKLIDDIVVPDDYVHRIQMANGVGTHEWFLQLPQNLEKIRTLWGLQIDGLLHSGVESIVLSCTSKEGPCVLKVMIAPISYITQRKAVQKMSHACFGKSCTPPLWHFDDDSHSMLMELIAGQHPTDPRLVDEQVRTSLNNIHSAGMHGDMLLTQYWEFRVQRTYSRLEQLAGPAEMIALMNKSTLLAQKLLSDQTLTLLHGDCHVENMLAVMGKVTLLDPWGLEGDPAFDHAAWLVKTAHLAGLESRIHSEREAQWCRALLPAQAVSLAYFGWDPEPIEILWALAKSL